MFKTTLVAALKAANEVDVDGIEITTIAYPDVSTVLLISFDEEHRWEFSEQEIVVLDDGQAEVAEKPTGKFMAEKRFLSFRVSGALTQAHMPDGESAKVIEGLDTKPPWDEPSADVLPVEVKP